MGGAGGARKGAGRKPMFSEPVDVNPFRAESMDVEAWRLVAQYETNGLPSWIRQTLNRAVPLAYRVAVQFGVDGQSWELDDGRGLAEVARKLGARCTVDGQSSSERWQFDDGSAIVATEQAWDVGFADLDDCFCWVGCQMDNPETGGHNGGCPHAEEF